MMMTVDDFNKQILRPMTLDGIFSGKFDSIIFGEDLDCVYEYDKEMMNAIKYRRAVLIQKGEK